jgi:hypothetical protein
MDADDRLDELIHRADLDGLVTLIDQRCSDRDWEGLLRVRDRSRAAVATGRQLWPAATLAEYRLALLAPPPFVAAVLDERDGLSGRFTIGPLTEVAAVGHTWAELAPVLDAGPRAGIVGHERALRGEQVDVGGCPVVFDMPVELQPWEPAYALAEYTVAGAQFPRPDLPRPTAEHHVGGHPSTAASADRTTDVPGADAVGLAVEQLLEPWTASSNGHVDVAGRAGTVDAALAALGVQRVRLVDLDAGAALAWIAWAGASGGAHGRRRGATAGRFGAWWLLAALGGLLDDPSGAADGFDPDELGSIAGELRWYRWDAGEPDVGWSLRIAVEDPVEDVAWAIAATDAD